MKTTLNYNTIETLQQQPAWKTFVDNVVEDCNVVFDDNLINITETVEDGRLVTTQQKLSDSQEVLSARHATLSYLNDVMHLNMLENISLKGLLHLLSVYGCRIKDIVQPESVLPHTFKVEGSWKNASVYGYDLQDVTNYDYETRGVKPENIDTGDSYADESDSDDYGDGNIPADCYEYLTDKNYEEEDTSFKYIYNIYGYCQKLPVLSTSVLRAVDDFYQFIIKNTSEIISYNMPKFIYVNKSDISFDSNNNIESINTDFVYYSDDVISETDGNSGIWKCTSDYLKKADANGMRMSRFDVIMTYYDIQSETVEKWTNNTTTAFVFNDNDKIDLIKLDKRIKYNSVDYAKEEYSVRFAMSEDSNIEKAVFKRLGRIGTKENLTPMQPVEVQYQYYVYEDSMYHSRWVIMDGVNPYFTITPTYLKTQLFSEECTLKAQPLFLYDNGASVSMCANFIDTLGGEGKISYEVEKFMTDEIRTRGIRAETNIEGEPITKNRDTQTVDGETVVSDDKPPVAEGVSYGDWFNKWEQFNNDDTLFFKRDVFTPLNFNSAIPEDSYNTYGMDNFFDGEKHIYPIYPSLEEQYVNNVEKTISAYKYKNTFQQQLFETMFFNHFVKVYPVTDTDSDDVISTIRLYCDNLELVAYGNIIPYIVSYDRKGVLNTDESSSEVYDDLDCSIFSKIMSYNKHTHLITVNNPVWFENSYTPKYVVVAYQNASPFNKTNVLNIVTEKNDAVKPVVGDLLGVFEEGNCSLNIYTKIEYEDYIEDLQLDEARKNIESIISKHLNDITVKYDVKKFIYGSYNARNDTENTDITITVTDTNESVYTVNANKSNGYFFFSQSNGYINNAGGTHKIEDIADMSFTSGGLLITSICFGDCMSNRLSLGGGLFEPMKNLEVLYNFKPAYNQSYKLDGANSSICSLWNKTEFMNKYSLVYINKEAFGGVASVTKSDKACPMFKNTKIKNFSFYDIDWGDTQNTVIDFNLESFFEGCIYLENIDFRLRNGNRLRITSLKNTFKGCKSLKFLNLKDVDLSVVKYADYGFSGCSRLETINADWGTNYVIRSMNGIFKDCKKLTEYGSFDHWKPIDHAVCMRYAFKGCGLKTIEFTSKFTVSDAEGVFDGCAAETLNINFDMAQDGVLSGIRMDNLTNIVKIGNVLTLSNWGDGSQTPFVLDTPNLSKSSWSVFVSKQSDEPYRTNSNTYYALIKLNISLFKKLKIGVDITLDEESGEYVLVSYPYIRVSPLQ